MSMDQVSPGLWIGDLPSALDVDKLRAHGIFSILSAMRGRLRIKETFIQHQILLDDSEDADILRHLLPSIHFIEAELDKGRGVLVHCHAGISRSATIVASYLMYSKNLDRETALEMIRNVRPNIEPNEGFLRQLEIFHQAHFKVSRRDKSTRMFYMERALGEVMNGDGSLSETDMFAKFPQTPSDSNPNTPGSGPRRHIRCKMCRQELAAREHMLDHGQLGPATPARSPAVSRRPSGPSSRHDSTNQGRPTVGAITELRPRRPSHMLSDSLSMSTVKPVEGAASGLGDSPKASASPAMRRSSSTGENPLVSGSCKGDEDLVSNSALEDGSDEDEALRLAHHGPPAGISDETARLLGRRMSDAVRSSLTSRRPSSDHVADNDRPETTVISPTDLVTELDANPKLAALRSHSFSRVSLPISAPILANPKCSGYFVEPMKWMEPLLDSGEMAGKILCPNSKCGAKLGNFDWAGVCCGCKAWVTPGFCINRSKVDEIVK